MRITIFYSWQSDLPNNTNRGMIGDAINKAKKIILEKNATVSEIRILSDSRDDLGTPDLVSSIFNKIDSCDIFIADISIINLRSDCRPTPNPNVLIELGYAARALGWNKLICVFNTEFGEVETLPFDIRSRKPLFYNTEKPNAKEQLVNLFVDSIDRIITNALSDKREFYVSKRTIDLYMQAILIDFCKLLFNEKEKYNYNQMLMTSYEDIKKLLTNKTLLGFYLYMNITKEINDFIIHFNSALEMYFLPEKNKRILAKLVFALREYKQLLDCTDILNCIGKEENFVLINGQDLNPKNPTNNYILARPQKDDTAIVVSGGEFDEVHISNLLNIYSFPEDGSTIFASAIFRIIEIVNEWISDSGKYFIANIKEISE